MILFGLEENSSLSSTKSSVDEILQFIVGRPVGINDLVRLGRPKQQSDGGSSALRPRPVLIKLSTVWDRRLVLASKRKLKSFRISRLFIREDVSPDQRLNRRRPPSDPSSGAPPSSGPVPSIPSGSPDSRDSSGTHVSPCPP